MWSWIRLNTGPASAKMLPKIGCQYLAVTGMITPVWTWRTILAQILSAKTYFRQSNGPMLCRTLVFSLPEWCAKFRLNSVNLKSRQRSLPSAQHLTDANGDISRIAISDCWLPRLGQYCAVLSASAIRTCEF